MITAKTSRGMCSELYGLSTDTKPIDVANASTFFEMDTSTLYIFDAIGKAWYEVVGKSSEFAANIASEYDETDTYAKGDYTHHEGKLYRAVVDINTAEEWDSDHWVEVLLADDVEDIAKTGDLVFCNADISATSGTVNTVAKTYFYPDSAKVGDCVVSKNGNLGLITQESGNNWKVTSSGVSYAGLVYYDRAMSLAPEDKELARANVDAFANGNVAATYDPTSTYSKDDYCIYSDKLYKALANISSPEAWTAAHWSQVTVGGEIASASNEVTAEAVASAIGDMSSTQIEQARADLVAEDLTNVAPRYNSTATYAVGDYCHKGGILYRCTTPISTAEAWTSGHWTQVTVGGELQNAGGSTVTAADVASAIGDMTSAQAAQAVNDLGAEPEKLEVTVTESSGVYSADKTYTEIWNAYYFDRDSYRNIAIRYGNGIFYSCESYNGSVFKFVHVDTYPSPVLREFTLTEVIGDANGAWTYREVALSEVPITVTVSGATPTITPEDNNIYECGELTSLTVPSFPATGSFVITFTSGSTATILTVPQTLILPDDFTVEANMRYEINVRNGYGLAAGWAVS